MSEVLIQAEDVSKKFCRDLKKSLWYGVQDVFWELRDQTPSPDHLRKGEFWSIDNVSFELKRGECLGLIGPNGAGKSTLLKMLNGLIKPDKGQIRVRGRVGALIELGAGFNPILTGRENIYVNGAVLGFSKKEIDGKFEAIVEFSEISEFLESPVQNYSSGMKVRLGFAVAAHMDPDVLLIDEVLAVGDVGFRAKCFNAIYDLMQKTAVIFVTHGMPQVSRICSDLVVLDKGVACYQGKDIPKGIDLYYSKFRSEERSLVTEVKEKAEIKKIALKSNCSEKNVVDFGEELSVYLECKIDKSIKHPNISLTIATQELQEIAQCSSYFNNVQIENESGEIMLDVNLGRIFLNPALYALCLTITTDKHGEVIYKCQNICQFRVKGDFVGHSPVQIFGQWQTR